jgi:hypothetical protein
MYKTPHDRYLYKKREEFAGDFVPKGEKLLALLSS